MTPFTKELSLKLDEICISHDDNITNLLPILQRAQELSEYNYISQDVASYIASRLKVPFASVASVISFYASISDKPRGKNIIQICKSTSCMINDYQSIKDILERELEISVGETTKDKAFSLEYTECIGACDISPAIRINKDVFGQLTESKLRNLLDEYRRI